MNTLIKRKSGAEAKPVPTFGRLVDSIFQDSLNRFFDDWNMGSVFRAESVPVNIHESDQSYEMEVIAPGLKKDDFKVNVSDDTLTVSFETREESTDKNEKSGWLKKEFSMHSFRRSFQIDDTVDAGKITATYRDGILQLTLPKKEGAGRISRTIEVN